MAKEMFVIELPDKNETYSGKEQAGVRQEGDMVFPVFKDVDFNTREQFLSSLKGMMSIAAREAKKAEDMVTIMNFFTLVKELGEDEPYLEVDSDDCKNLKEGFEKMKPEERSIGAYQHYPQIFSQICSPKTKKQWDEEHSSVEG